MEKEIWKTIAGFSNYEVSSLGSVRNKKTLALLRQFKNNNGYMVVYLRRKYKPHLKLVHRLVARAFCEKLAVNHIDGNPCNNTVSNLEWVTPYGNVMHAIQMERQNDQNRRFRKRTKLTNENIAEAKSMQLTGLSQKEIGKFFGVNGSTISRVLSKR